MTQHVSPNDQTPLPRRRRHPALALLWWLLPSLLAAFAVPGFMVLQTASAHGGADFVLSARAIAALQTMGWTVLVLSVVSRAILWPPRPLVRFVRRMT